MEQRMRSRSPAKRVRARCPPKASPQKSSKPRVSPRGAGGWMLLTVISVAALYSQLRVAGVLGSSGDAGAGERHSLLAGLGGAKGERAKMDYRRLHSHEAIVPPEELQCRGRLTHETVALIRPQLREEREAAEEALAGARPLPLFLAGRGSTTKRCRASPRGSKKPPRLHRVVLLTPDDGTGLAWATATASVRRARRLQHSRRQQQLRVPGAGGELAARYGGQEGSTADITVITQLSIDRLPSLKHQCASWRGPTAAVVYAPLVGGRLVGLAGSLDPEVAALEGGTPLDALNHVRRVYHSMSGREGGCSLTLELVVEERCNTHLAALWPINANRNRALMLAATPAVLLADVDFILGGSLSPSLRETEAAAAAAAAQYRRLLAEEGAVLEAAAAAAASEAGEGAAAAAGDNNGGGSSSSSSSGGSKRSSSVGSKRSSSSSSIEVSIDTSDAAIQAGLAALMQVHAGSKNRSRDDAWLAGVRAAAQEQGVGWLEAVLAQNAAVVLPAFQPTAGGRRRDLARGMAVALAAASGDKRQLVALAVGQPQQVIGFQQAKYARGHRATRYWWWLQAQQPYAVDYWQGYEPFLLMSTAATPFYDERFRGYGWDKHVHTLHAVRQLGTRLVVHPDAWLVHLPHPHSAAQSESHLTGQRARLHDLFTDARRRILNHRYTPVSSYWRLCAPPRQADAAAEWAAAAARESARQRREEEEEEQEEQEEQEKQEEQEEQEEEAEPYTDEGDTGAAAEEAEEQPWADEEEEQQEVDGASDYNGSRNADDQPTEATELDDDGPQWEVDEAAAEDGQQRQRQEQQRLPQEEEDADGDAAEEKQPAVDNQLQWRMSKL